MRRLRRGGKSPAMTIACGSTSGAIIALGRIWNQIQYRTNSCYGYGAPIADEQPTTTNTTHIIKHRSAIHRNAITSHRAAFERHASHAHNGVALRSAL